jgi:SAM-dependent methyltransferase
MTPPAVVRWTEQGEARSALWRSEDGAPAPRHIADADDRTAADEAYGLACQGTALLWRGDFQNARQMLLALGRRADRRPRRSRSSAAPVPSSAVSQRARTLNSLLVPLDETYTIPLARAPDVRQACTEAYGEAREPSLISLRALLGVIGAHEWRVRGIEIPAAGGRIHPHYGVFAPIRHEYIDLVASAPLPATLLTGGTAFDIGTGTGVLAAVLARRGAARVIATDLDPRAVACARENLETLGWAQHVEVVEADLFPPQRAALAVCNPPWLPARPSSSLARAVYDPQGRMLQGFLDGLAAHLEPGGEGWLILSDLAEHLGLRSRQTLLAAFAAARLQVLGRDETRPSHARALDPSDPLHAARAAEMTSLWRLAPF